MIPMKLCKLFCPPCPTNIIEKIAFCPPKPPSYSLQYNEDENRYCFYTEKETGLYFFKTYMRYHNVTDFFYSETCYGSQIACMYIKIYPEKKLTLFYSHGNGSDLGGTFSFLSVLANKLKCNAFSYDYSGYGVSSGKPSEKNLYEDIAAAYKTLLDRYELQDTDIILYGQSLGTVPTINLASLTEPAGVIIQSGMLSACKIAFDKPPICCDTKLKNIDKVPKVTSPVLVIHGTEDEVIDFSHGLAIYERCPRAVEPLWVEGAGHNDVELYSQYLERLKQFVSVELLN